MSGEPACRVLVLRPMPGNTETVGRLAALGIVALPMPLFAVEPVAWVPPRLADIDALLLTSANAVRHAGRAMASVSAVPAWCVGEATAAAARGAGLTVARVGTEGVTALIAGTSQRLLWLCGEERTTLPHQDEQRVTALPVYCSAELPFPESALDHAGVAMLHSARAARRLAALVPDRASIAIVAISADVAAAAGEGWRCVAVAARPDDAEMVAIAAKLCQDSGRGVRQ